MVLDHIVECLVNHFDWKIGGLTARAIISSQNLHDGFDLSLVDRLRDLNLVVNQRNFLRIDVIQEPVENLVDLELVFLGLLLG